MTKLIAIIIASAALGCAARLDDSQDGVTHCLDGTTRVEPQRCIDPPPCSVQSSCTYYLPSEDATKCDEVTVAQAHAYQDAGHSPSYVCRANMGPGGFQHWDLGPCAYHEDPTCETIFDEATGCTWKRCPGR